MTLAITGSREAHFFKRKERSSRREASFSQENRASSERTIGKSGSTERVALLKVIRRCRELLQPTIPAERFRRTWRVLGFPGHLLPSHAQRLLRSLPDQKEHYHPNIWEKEWCDEGRCGHDRCPQKRPMANEGKQTSANLFYSPAAPSASPAATKERKWLESGGNTILHPSLKDRGE